MWYLLQLSKANLAKLSEAAYVPDCSENIVFELLENILNCRRSSEITTIEKAKSQQKNLSFSSTFKK